MSRTRFEIRFGKNIEGSTLLLRPEFRELLLVYLCFCGYLPISYLLVLASNRVARLADLSSPAQLQQCRPHTVHVLLSTHPIHEEGGTTVLSFVTSSPATLAEVSVLSTPENSAERATLDTSPDRDGAICESTPICVPREPRLPKP